MTARRVAVGLIVVCTVYLVFAGWRGIELMRNGGPVGVVMGVAVLVVPVVVAWLIYREVRFGLATQEMARVLEAEGGLPVDDLPRLPSGRAERDAADAAFQLRRDDVAASPSDWRAWFRLALAYDDARDRRRARAAMRRAWALYQDLARAPDLP